MPDRANDQHQDTQCHGAVEVAAGSRPSRRSTSRTYSASCTSRTRAMGSPCGRPLRRFSIAVGGSGWTRHRRLKHVLSLRMPALLWSCRHRRQPRGLVSVVRAPKRSQLGFQHGRVVSHQPLFSFTTCRFSLVALANPCPNRVRVAMRHGNWRDSDRRRRSFAQSAPRDRRSLTRRVSQGASTTR